MNPLVTVIIPTYKRPVLLLRAVKSALAQTLKQIEVIVIIDGPDEATVANLAQIDDSRLRIIEQPTNQGCVAARQAGIKASQSQWIAHLDDDDEWMPQKLELQLEKAIHSPHKMPIISCLLIAKTPQGDTIWPRRIPRISEPISEYLFVRNDFAFGEGLIQSSTIFTSKQLLEKVPHRNDINEHEDWNWLLNAINLKDVGIEFVDRPLSIWDIGGNHQSLSRSAKWKTSFNWIEELRQSNLVTPKAYSSFILSEIGAKAAKANEWGVFWILLWKAMRRGEPSFKDLLVYGIMWLVPQDTRRRLRVLLIDKNFKNV